MAKRKPPIENKIYDSVILHCERIENKGQYRGNGHHLAQTLTWMVAESLLPKQQKKIYDALVVTPTSTKDIAKKVGLPSKIVSVQLRQIQESTLLVLHRKKGKLCFWYRANTHINY